MKFVIFHGSLGLNNSNWFPDLKTKLEYMGQKVICPQFPIDKVEKIKRDSKTTVQNLESWYKTFEKEVLPHLNSKEKIVFIGHSLGNLFILHCVEKYKIKLDCAIFVSPCLESNDLTVPWYYDKVNTTFYKTDFNYPELLKHIPTSYVIFSDSDPYIKPNKSFIFAKLFQSSHIMVRRAGHLNSEVNINEFPLVFELCVTRLDLTLHQKYILKKRLDEAVKSIKTSEKKFIRISKEEVNDEGRFHYMNLTKNGFATFLSNAKDWNPEDEYFMACREASRRGIPITRVIIIKDPNDLKRDILKRQIRLDKKAGIDIRFIDNSEIQKIKCEEDFGLWDNEFICILKRDKAGNLLEGILDSRIKSILTAQNWRDRIMRASRKVSSD